MNKIGDMGEVSGSETIRTTMQNKLRKYPDRLDIRFKGSMIFPEIKQKFLFTKNKHYKIFTIGSCFARNIEEVLSKYKNLYIPTSNFKVPKNEWPYRPNGILNEYTLGTISQRIIYAVKNKSFGDKGLFEIQKGKIVDSLLVPINYSVTYYRALQRKKEIENLYKELLTSYILIITLGYIESWIYDDIYINRMSNAKIVKNDGKFRFKRLNVIESFNLLKEVLKKLFSFNSDIKVIITVSSVPLQSTFTPYDYVAANFYSNSTLRVVSTLLYETFNNIDYFPSYEIVNTYRSEAYIEDSVHIKLYIVELITQYFIEEYFQ